VRIVCAAASSLVLIILVIVLIRLHVTQASEQAGEQDGEQAASTITSSPQLEVAHEPQLEVAHEECLQAMFRLFDRDASGRISKAEVRSKLVREDDSILLDLGDKKLELAHVSPGEQMFFGNWTDHEMDVLLSHFHADADADGD